MARILLAVTGGIAAYKAVDVLRALQREGNDVTVMMTATAERFVGAATFAALSGHPVGTTLFPGTAEAGYDHLDFARAADAMIVVPASANTLARMAAGIANDLVTTTYLAVEAPVIVAPAMNTRMWLHAATRANMDTLRSRGVQVVPPATGLLADGDVGEGRLAETVDILAAVDRALGKRSSLRGVRVLVTGGGTREPIDSVRYVGNRSSGRMAVAIAEAARDRGAVVTLIASNLTVALPAGVVVIDAPTAAELHAQALRSLPQADIVVMAAAVADYRPIAQVPGKMDKSASAELTITLERTDDILLDLAARRTPTQLLIGFAAEHGAAGVERAREKRARKRVDLIVHNDIALPGVGFEGPDNAVTIVGDTFETAIGPASKRACAEAILDAAGATRDAQRSADA